MGDRKRRRGYRAEKRKKAGRDKKEISIKKKKGGGRKTGRDGKRES